MRVIGYWGEWKRNGENWIVFADSMWSVIGVVSGLWREVDDGFVV